MSNDEIGTLRAWAVPPSARIDDELSGLDQLAQATDPTSRDATAECKDAAAFRALHLAGQMVAACADWAIHHQVGLAWQLREPLLAQTEAVRNLPEYAEAKSLVDSHFYEEIGGQVSQDDLDGEMARRVLLNILLPLSDIMPASVHERVIEGLRALEFGEVTPIFRPAATTAKRKHRELLCELRAIGHVAYWRASGMQASASQKKVALYFGVEAETLRRWEAPVRDALGRLAVSEEIAAARNAASVVQAMAREPDQSGVGASLAAAYGDKAMRRDGDRYQALLREEA